MPKRVICPEFIERAKALRSEGMTRAEIASTLGVCVKTIATAIGLSGVNHGGRRKQHRHRKMTHDQAREALGLMLNGTPDKVLCRMYNCDRATVHRAVARLDTPLPVRNKRGQQPVLRGERLARMQELLGLGVAKTVVAKMLGIHRMTIYRTLERLK